MSRRAALFLCLVAIAACWSGYAGRVRVHAEVLTLMADKLIALVEAYARAQGMFRTDDSPEAVYSDTLELDLSTIVPSIAGPKRPQDRVPLSESKAAWEKAAGHYENSHQGREQGRLDEVRRKLKLAE